MCACQRWAIEPYPASSDIPTCLTGSTYSLNSMTNSSESLQLLPSSTSTSSWKMRLLYFPFLQSPSHPPQKSSFELWAQPQLQLKLWLRLVLFFNSSYQFFLCIIPIYLYVCLSNEPNEWQDPYPLSSKLPSYQVAKFIRILGAHLDIVVAIVLWEFFHHTCMVLCDTKIFYKSFLSSRLFLQNCFQRNALSISSIDTMLLPGSYQILTSHNIFISKKSNKIVLSFFSPKFF